MKPPLATGFMVVGSLLGFAVGKPSLWIIGDSTAHNVSMGQQGWGEPFARLFDPAKITVKNRAAGGRSSRTFLTDGRWDSILQKAQRGDFVLIQFGRNDATAVDRSRGSLEGIGDEAEGIINSRTKKPEVVHTYGWYLRRYIGDARSHGLTPVVLSPVPQCPRPGESILPDAPATGYRLWSRQVAEMEKAPFVDVYGLIWSDYAKMTPSTIRSGFFTGSDLTHTNPAGAQFNAAHVLKGLRSLPGDPFGGFHYAGGPEPLLGFLFRPG